MGLSVVIFFATVRPFRALRLVIKDICAHHTVCVFLFV